MITTPTFGLDDSFGLQVAPPLYFLQHLVPILLNGKGQRHRQRQRKIHWC